MTYYDHISKGYNELYKEEQLKKIKIIKNNLKIKKTDKLLDVGCGTGFSLDYFNCDKTGIDPSEELIKQSKHKCIKAKAEQIPFKDNSFEVVISITAIHNFDDIEKGLQEMERVGRNKFVFSVLKKSKKFNQIRKLINKYFKIEKEIKEEKDVIFFCNNKI